MPKLSAITKADPDYTCRRLRGREKGKQWLFYYESPKTPYESLETLW
jgi:hypothetical protein